MVGYFRVSLAFILERSLRFFSGFVRGFGAGGGILVHGDGGYGVCVDV